MSVGQPTRTSLSCWSILSSLALIPTISSPPTSSFRSSLAAAADAPASPPTFAKPAFLPLPATVAELSVPISLVAAVLMLLLSLSSDSDDDDDDTALTSTYPSSRSSVRAAPLAATSEAVLPPADTIVAELAAVAEAHSSLALGGSERRLYEKAR